MKSLKLVSTTLSLLVLLGASTALSAKDRPGPQSIPRHTKVDFSKWGEVFGDSSKKEGEKATETSSAPAEGQAEAAAPPTLLLAVIQPTEGFTASGMVIFEKVEEGVKVTGRIEGLRPGDHGFHVHQYGDISADDGTSAGGHFNPGGQPHASRESAHRHVGDLGNITADENGVAEFSFVDSELAMEGPDSIIGRGLIVHRDADDLTSQPTGAAGPRVGMAVIGVANPDAERM